MAFVIQEDLQKSDTGFVRREETEIACQCWFTSRGKMQPLMFKYQDEHGEVHMIKDITVHSSEDKNFMGTAQEVFHVSINCQGIEIKTQLIFYKKDCRWTMVLGRK